MCGIFGYVGGYVADVRGSTDAAGIVLHGLKKLEYRGYDSWGIAVAQTAASCGKARRQDRRRPDALCRRAPSGSDTRAGRPTAASPSANAHPHLDCHGPPGDHPQRHHRRTTGSSATTLDRRGPPLRSETDTEVVAHLLEDELGAHAEGPSSSCRPLMACSAELDGLNAIGVLDSGPAARGRQDGSPLVLGGARTATTGLRLRALLEHTRRLTFLEDGQAALLERRTASPSTTSPPAPSRRRGQRDRLGGEQAELSTAIRTT